MTLLQIERRFLDLESEFSEIKEKLKDWKVEALPEIQQKIEGLEDLIMVEQAAIIELKKMLEEPKEKEATTPEEIEAINFKLSELEKKIGKAQSIPISSGAAPKISEEDAASIAKDVDSLKLSLDSRISDLESKVKGIESKQTVSVPSPTTGTGTTKDIADRVSEIEKNLAEIKQSQDGVKKLEDNLKKMGEDLAGAKTRDTKPLVLANVPGRLEVHITDIVNEISSLRSSVEKRVRELDRRLGLLETTKSIKPTADYDFLSSKVESMKAGIDLLTDKKVETDLKIAGLEEKSMLLENRIKETLSEKFYDAIKGNQRDLLATNIRVESVERVLRKMLEDINSLNKSVSGFDRFEHLTILAKEIEENIETIKLIRDESRRLSKRIEAVYDEMNHRLENMDKLERKMNDAFSVLSGLNEEVKLNKSELKQKINKKELDLIQEFFDEKSKVIENEIKEFESRIRILQKSSIDKMEKMFDETSRSHKAVNERFNVFENEVEIIKNKLKIAVRGGVLTEDEQKNEEYGEAHDTVAELRGRIESMGDEINKLRVELTREISQARVTPTTEDIRSADLMDKYVFLETRLSVIEDILEKTLKEIKGSKNVKHMTPVVLE
jgi:DNA repair exonuclease SbcCD ATPase subunit